MNVIIRKIGNSEGIIIPKEILQKRGLAAGDNLVIMEDGDDLRIKRVQDDREEFERKMKIARERMKDHLPKLVPTLFRYTHDPNPKINARCPNITILEHDNIIRLEYYNIIRLQFNIILFIVL